MTPLYNHTSMATAYLVDDYPYGRKLRCRIRYWVEHRDNHGYRFVSQTERPDGTRWNKPKASTYSPLAACLYLDDNGHVQCSRLQYSCKPDQALAFVLNFPGASTDALRPYITAKVHYLQGRIDGRYVLRINGEPVAWTPTETASHRAELATWLEVEAAIAK